jgi:hypothetical protein
MSALAITGDAARGKGRWTRLRLLRRAATEYVRLMVQAQRTWLVGTAAGVGTAWLNVLPGIAVPGWIVAGIIVATLAAAQFQAFYCVREEREAFVEARRVDSILGEVAALRTRETELRNRPVCDPDAYAQWKAELMALRSEIMKRIERISPAEAETFHTVGNLKFASGSGINDEHSLLLAVATRDLDHLAELIHGYTRFGD